MKAAAYFVVLVAAAAVVTACTRDEKAKEGTRELAAFERVLGPLPVPPGNPQTPEKVELGKLLFFDPRLSGDNKMSCATCHDPSKGFSDGLARAVGAKGELGRASFTVWNSAYLDFLFWDGRVSSLEEQASKPIAADVEMNQKIPELMTELEAVPEYRDRFRRVFGSEGITFTQVIQAIAAFERTVISANSAFDRFEAGDKNALSPEARRGRDVFFGKAACATCHTTPLFTDNKFHVLGVPEVGPKADEPARSQQLAEGLVPTGRRVAGDLGRFEVTGDPREHGAFRTPTLRNIELTGPYMHDGAFGTLEEVIDFYDKGGGDVDNKSPLIRALNLTPEEKTDLVAYLKSLTDTSADIRAPERLP